MRTRRTQAPHSSRPRAARMRSLVAALLAAPLALGTLAATALPAAAEPEAVTARVTIGATAPVGQPVPVSFTCPTDPDHPLPSIGYMVDETRGLESYGGVLPASPAPGDTSVTLDHTVTFSMAGEYRVEMFCHNGLGGHAAWVTAGAAAPLRTTTALNVASSVVEPGTPIAVQAVVFSDDGPATEGTVQFFLDGNPAGPAKTLDSSGTASTQIDAAPGQRTLSATYSGSEHLNLEQSTSETSSVRVKWKSVVTAAVPERTRAPQVTLHAAVVPAPDFPAPGGTITFTYDGGKLIGEAPLVGGAAVLSLPNIAPGVYEKVVASYSGDKSYSSGVTLASDMIVDPPFPTAPVKSPTEVTVDVPAKITGTRVEVKVSVAPGMQWTAMSSIQAAHLSGSVAVTLTKGGERQKATLVDGGASVVFDGVAPGTYEVEAVYGGDTNYDSSTGRATTTVSAVVVPPVVPPVTPPVTPPAPDLSGSTSTLPAGGTITLVARDFLPGETVSFYLHSDPIFLGTAVADADGVATLVVAIPADAPAGAHHVRATGQTSQRTAEIPVTVTAAAPPVTTPVVTEPVVTAPIVTVPVAAAPVAETPVAAPVAAAPVAAPLAATGAEIGSTALLVSVLLAAGALLVVGRRRFSTSS